MLERFGKLLDDESEPPEVKDFGFWHSEDAVFDVCNMLKAFHVLPGGGGWMDQEEDWTDDIKMWYALYARQSYEREQHKNLTKMFKLDTEADDFFSQLSG